MTSGNRKTENALEEDLELSLLLNIFSRAKKGAFKDASKEEKKKYGKETKNAYGKPEAWTKENLDDMKDLFPYISSKDLKKVPKHVVSDRSSLK